MKLGILSDIHANQPALEAVLSEFETESVDEVICAGDIVGVLGSPNEVATTIRETTEYVVFGNHDSRVFPEREWMPVHDFEVLEYEQTLDEMSEENMDWLTSLPGVIHTDFGVTIAHSRPDPEAPHGAEKGDAGVHPKDFVTIGSEYVDGGILILGHTHYQHGVSLDRFEGQSGLVLNPGSVGFPFDAGKLDDGTRVGEASYAIVDTETQECELETVEYDATAIIEFLLSHDILTPEGPTDRRATL